MHAVCSQVSYAWWTSLTSTTGTNHCVGPCTCSSPNTRRYFHPLLLHFDLLFITLFLRLISSSNHYNIPVRTAVGELEHDCGTLVNNHAYILAYRDSTLSDVFKSALYFSIFACVDSVREWSRAALLLAILYHWRPLHALTVLHARLHVWTRPRALLQVNCALGQSWCKPLHKYRGMKEMQESYVRMAAIFR